MGKVVTHFTNLTLFISSFFQIAKWEIYLKANSQILDGYWNSPTILGDLREVRKYKVSSCIIIQNRKTGNIKITSNPVWLLVPSPIATDMPFPSALVSCFPCSSVCTSHLHGNQKIPGLQEEVPESTNKMQDTQFGLKFRKTTNHFCISYFTNTE